MLEPGAYWETQKGEETKNEVFVKAFTKCTKGGGAKDCRPSPQYAYGYS